MQPFDDEESQDAGEPTMFSSKLALLGGALLVLVPCLYQLASLAGWTK